MPMELAVFQNPHLPLTGDSLQAVISVRAPQNLVATPAAAATGPAKVVLVLDGSGSMGEHKKWPLATAAVSRALEALTIGTQWAIILGRGPESVVLRGVSDGRPLKINFGNPVGGTYFSAWLYAARAELKAGDTLIFVSDGANAEADDYTDELRHLQNMGVTNGAALGLGDDWHFDEMNRIAAVLGGDIELIARAEQAAQIITEVTATATARASTATMTVWTPVGVTITALQQVAPTIAEVKSTGKPTERLETFSLGGWASGEAREYMITLVAPPKADGTEMLAARVNVSIDGTDDPSAPGLIKAIRSSNESMTAGIPLEVATHTGQVAIAQAIQEGLTAKANDDLVTARKRLGDALALAETAGDTGTQQALSALVSRDAQTGRVDLKQTSKADDLEVAVRSTRTKIVGK